MRSPTDNYQPGDVAVKATWLLLAVAINALELAFPRIPFLPWLKPGLANTITIIWIIKYGLSDALLYTVLRVWISGFYFGFSLLTLSLGLGGGILSTVVMGILWNILGKKGFMGTIGLGISGALFHNLGQLGVIYILMARNFRIFYQLPFMFGAALIFGGIVGALAIPLMRILEKSTQGEGLRIKSSLRSAVPPSLTDTIAGSAMLITSLALLFTANFILLAVTALLVTIISFTLQKFDLRVLYFPLGFYWIFLFTGFIHLFFSYGTRIDFLPFITIEGLHDTAIQWIRLWTWLSATFIFKRFRFHDLFFRLLGRTFPQKSSTLDAGIIALEYFPQTIRFSHRARIGKLLGGLITRPLETFRVYVEDINGRIAAVLTR